MTEATRGAGRRRFRAAVLVFALVATGLAAATAPAGHAQTTAKKASAPGKKAVGAAKTPPRAARRPAPVAKVGDPLQRRGLSGIGYLKGTGKSSTGVLRSRSRLSDAGGGKAGTSPLDRWSMTKQKQTTRAWQKAGEHDNRGRSLLPRP